MTSKNIRSDPFFTARSRKDSITWGRHPGYVEDIYRTYGNFLPPRQSSSYDRALKFRQQELASWESERNHNTDILQRMTGSLQDTITAYTDLKSKYDALLAQNSEPKNDKSDDGASSGGGRRVSFVQDTSTSHSDVAGERSAEVQPEPVSSTVPDNGGPATEHNDEGRREGSVDATGSVVLDKQPVQEGGK